jgi:8-oxo-dGTP pyrophosphatase MutT (NUDIX family)
MRAVITAGGTFEPIDDVRGVTNRSTGRFGVAIASALHDRGVAVTVLAARAMATDALPAGVEVVRYTSTADLDRALAAAIASPPDLLLMAAAVADYSPAADVGKRSSAAPTMVIEMQRNPKLLSTLRERCGDTTRIVGFKLLSGVDAAHLIAVAQAQRTSNHLDLTIANDLRELSGDRHPIWWVDSAGAARIDGDREAVADAIADRLVPATDEVPPWLSPVDGGPVRGRWRRWWALARGRVEQGPPGPPSPAAWARAGVDLHQPVVWEGADGARVGAAPADAAAWKAAWGRAGLNLAHTPVFERGALVGAVPDDPQASLVSFVAAPTWTWSLPSAARWRAAPDAARALRAVGWAVDDDGVATHPAARTDLRRAASLLLWDRLAGRVLLGRRLAGAGQGALAPPGGRLEDGESAWAAACRELREETGIEVAGAPDAAHQVYGDGWEITAFVLDVLEPPAPSPSAELDAAWIELAAARRRSDLTPGTAWLLGRIG